MNMEDAYVKDDDDDLPSLPKTIFVPPKEKQGFFSKIKRKKSNKSKEPPQHSRKNSTKSGNLSETEEKDAKTQQKGPNSARGSFASDDKNSPQIKIDKSLERKDSDIREEVSIEPQSGKEKQKKDPKCPIPPSPNVSGKKGSSIKIDLNKAPEAQKERNSLKSGEKSARSDSSPNNSTKTESKASFSDLSEKRQSSQREESLKKSQSTEKTQSSDRLTNSTRESSDKGRVVAPEENKKREDSLEKRRSSQRESMKKEESKSIAKPALEEKKSIKNQEPVKADKPQAKEKKLTKNLDLDTGSVSSESLSRKSSYQNDQFLDEYLASKHMQGCKSEANLNKKSRGKKLTNSLIRLRREETQNYRADLKSDKACSKCIVI